MFNTEKFGYATVVYNQTSFIPSLSFTATISQNESYSFILLTPSTYQSYLLSITGGIAFSLLFFASEQRREDSKKEKKNNRTPSLIPFAVNTDCYE